MPHQDASPPERGSTGIGAGAVGLVLIAVLTGGLWMLSRAGDTTRPPYEGASCSLFTKSLAEGTKLTIVDWAGRTGGEPLLPAAAMTGRTYRLSGQAASPDPAGRSPVTSLRLQSSGLRVEASDAAKDKPLLEGPLVIKAGELTAEQKKSLFSAVDGSGLGDRWLLASDDEKRVYRIRLGDNPGLLAAILDAGLDEIAFAKGEAMSFEDYDEKTSTATLVHTAAEKATPVRLKDYFNVQFALPFSTALAMEPVDLARGSLRAVDSPRTVGRTALKLAATLKAAPFGNAVFRGCLIYRDKAGSWSEIPNFQGPDIKRITAQAGEAEISLMLPELPREAAPDVLDTLYHLIFGGRENIWIHVEAADDTGIVYLGETSHFIDDRWAAFWAGLVAVAFAYMLPFWFLWRSGRLKAGANLTLSPLNLIRGRNGTASLSNLQILFWSVTVFGLLIYVWMATGTLATFDQSILWLLGIAGAGSLAAKTVAATVKGQAQTIVALQGSTSQFKTSAWDLISAGDQVDLSKLQMLIFTVVTGIYVVTTVWSQLTFPEVPSQMLMLMGLSNGIYVLSKIPESNPVVQLAMLRIQLETLTEQVTATKARKAEIEAAIATPKDGADIGKLKKELAELEQTLKTLEAAQTETTTRITKAEAAAKAAANPPA